jgi:hypothetical protein
MSVAQDTKSPASEKPEPQQITPQTGELDAEKLDEIAGGGYGLTGGYKAPPPPPPII